MVISRVKLRCFVAREFHPTPTLPFPTCSFQRAPSQIWVYARSCMSMPVCACACVCALALCVRACVKVSQMSGIANTQGLCVCAYKIRIRMRIKNTDVCEYKIRIRILYSLPMHQDFVYARVRVLCTQVEGSKKALKPIITISTWERCLVDSALS
jgi:hypothetical protein